MYIHTNGILLLCFFFSFGKFFLPKALVLSIPSFISCFLDSLSINLLCNLSSLSWNALFVAVMLRKHVAFANGMFHFKETRGVLIYDVNKPVDWISSCRSWLPVYPILFYKRQYLRNLSLHWKS